MKSKNSINNVFVPEKQTWVNKETGQEIEGYQSVRTVSRENFAIVYLQELCDLFDDFGTKKLKVLRVILNNMDLNNLVIMTQEKIAEEANVSRKTVIDTIKILENKCVLSKKNGVIFINPKLINRGSPDKEKWLVVKFQEFEEDSSIIREKNRKPKFILEKIKKEKKNRQELKKKNQKQNDENNQNTIAYNEIINEIGEPIFEDEDDLEIVE